MPFHIGLLVFPDITQLDMTGPYEVFIKFPDAKVHLIWKAREPVTAGGGMQIVPTTTFADCPQLDLICAPRSPSSTADCAWRLHRGCERYSPFHPQADRRARRCGGTGATTRTGSLFFEIGTTTSRACSCSPGASARGTNLIWRARRWLASLP